MTCLTLANNRIVKETACCNRWPLSNQSSIRGAFMAVESVEAAASTSNTRSYIIRFEGDTTPATCCKCVESKPPHDYYTHSVRGDGAIRYRPACKSCRQEGPRTMWARPKHASILKAGKQVCMNCGCEKPLTEFYSNGCFADGITKYRTRCKDCVKQQRKEAQPVTQLVANKRRSSTPKNFMANLINHASKRKHKKGFNIDLLYVCGLYEAQRGLCAITGVKMTYVAGKGNVPTNISIDRIDSSIGYAKGNVQLTCRTVNIMKSNMTMSELRHWCRLIGGQR